ncbi:MULTISPECIES: LTA synthase family protein [Flavobacterium]|uniref:Sulfatase-like hydrolase/transferase n=1 Tax=Flavobacterium covae TaxID=2906076 RepID=A0ABW8PGV8_9FLAO|nr:MULTISPECIES: alkaline phosphatase family protein [Flavobacterium]OXA83167.1 sulfatase [Flavobacterium columnare] [Flavobacterium columnare NBRC 100251 = ATCC 23463]AMA49166.1 sulfatase [Flavobacterium covae]MCJ1806320.1 sulfatase-like hydrolase/transferase [Flavobacterium covae]MCJ1809740.1 sulfatase-like hydrolase/transferase [Flavobacterium covae]OWP80632.1 sulfatase [Flavobacterium covae]
MIKHIRIQEYKALIYRILLVYAFYSFVRILFTLFNLKFLKIDSLGQFLKLAFHGLTFDTTAILYVNSLFILLSIFPLWINTRKGYQTVLLYVYFITNLIAYATNFIDFIYYKYIYSRTTIAILDIAKHESNKGNMFFRFIVSYWYVYLLFFITAFVWIKLYKLVKVQEEKIEHNWKYFLTSKIGVIIILVLSIGGIRGDFKKSTRPINLIDANQYVTKPQHADIVLNTPFALIRTFRTTTFQKVNYTINDSVLKNQIQPIKQYRNYPLTKPNIVVFITESFGREYWGCMNKNTTIPGFKSYTPFLDELAKESLIFTNAYANGSKSIHGMSSVIAGIPSFRDAFTSSPYPNQKIQSLVSCLKELGYDTSFFHGAPNGSMGFMGFGNILGFDHYYGKTEFNDDTQHDGVWGIWDEPFMQFMKKTLDQKKTPFFSTIFTVSSHEPYIVPKKYEGKFPKGTSPMHQCVGYTDYAFKRFFEEAKKQPWFKNTIFIITADHTNLTAYPEYDKIVNRQAVPILIYKPDRSLKGENSDLAQQIDIYPTLLDMIGYSKPFRSWGRSLVNKTDIMPFAINFNGNSYQLQRGNYICTFDGNQDIHFYDKNDKALEKELSLKPNQEMLETAEICKALIKDYFDRIIDKKLAQ